MSMISEFKKFALRGNVMDMAVGIIIGGAFGTVVKSLVDDVIMPPDRHAHQRHRFQRTWPSTIREADAANNIKAVTLNYGSFINNVISFLIIAWAVFMLVKAMNAAEIAIEPRPATRRPATAGRSRAAPRNPRLTQTRPSQNWLLTADERRCDADTEQLICVLSARSTQTATASNPSSPPAAG